MNEVGLARNPDPPQEVPANPVFICSGCGENILEGDWYWEFFGEQFCEYCNDQHRQTAMSITDTI
jgi:formylmethanofuran dehydrogenase subunit E